MTDILAMLSAERDKLNRAIEALGGEVGHAIIRLTKQAKRRAMSAETRAKIAATQKARWAKGKVESAVAKPVRKFTMSAAAKAKISKAMKARWAAKKKGG
jgi:hypothetical protein